MNGRTVTELDDKIKEPMDDGYSSKGTEGNRAYRRLDLETPWSLKGFNEGVEEGWKDYQMSVEVFFETRGL